MTDSLVFVTARLRSAWTVAVLRSPAFTPAQKNVLVALREFADFRHGGNARPGMGILTACSGASRAVVGKALAAAVDAGFLVRVKRGGGRSGGPGSASVYQLSMPESVVADALGALGRLEDEGSNEAPESSETVGNEAPHGATFGNNESPHGATFGENGAPHGDTFQTMRLPTNVNEAPHGATTTHDQKYMGVTYVRKSRADASPASPIQESSTEENTTGRDSGADAAALGVDLLGPPPAARCGRHIGEAWAPPCGKCADARRRFETWDVARVERDRTAATERRAAIAACDRCDEMGFVDLGGAVARCDHRPGLRVVGGDR